MPLPENSGYNSLKIKSSFEGCQIQPRHVELKVKPFKLYPLYKCKKNIFLSSLSFEVTV
jgi:hypothetical protein